MTEIEEKAGREAGALEVEITFAPEAGGDAVKATSTPSMWAIADEWVDTLRATAAAHGLLHTKAWYDGKMVAAIQLQAARAAGILPEGPLTLGKIAEMLNAYDVSMPKDAGTGDGAGPDPTGAAAGA